MIEIQGLTKKYGDFTAVDNISFDVKKGEILGFLGPNGAGKTTTMRILTCYLKPTEGTITVKGMDIHNHPLEIKSIMGYLPESAPLYPDMLVYDYLLFVSDVRDLRAAERIERVKKLARLCQISEVMHKPIHELSKGYKQRVGLAHAMMNDPEILVLDEPTSGLDPNQIVEIREIIREIGKEKTVILSTHILSEAEATCDRLVIINKGEIAADGATEELKKRAGNEHIVNISLINAKYDDVENSLKTIPEISNITLKNANGTLDFTVSYADEKDIRPEIYRTIKKSDWDLVEFHTQGMTLENIFRDLTRGE
jgi:ABC-2 type transport system ATP-binding protein